MNRPATSCTITLPFVSIAGGHPASGITHRRSAILQPGYPAKSPPSWICPPSRTKTLHYDYGQAGRAWKPLPTKEISIASSYGLPQGATIRYYFSATDALENSATLPANAPDETYSFNILPTQDTQVLIATAHPGLSEKRASHL